MDSQFIYVSMDVNGLKIINDRQGHAAGDELICVAASCMKTRFDRYGKVYRMGGDEFAVYQDGIEKTSVVYELADSILEKVHNVAIDMKLHDNVTVSIGAVIVTDGDVSFDKIYQEADKQLYCSKRKSKNCYTVSEVRL